MLILLEKKREASATDLPEQFGVRVDRTDYSNVPLYPDLSLGPNGETSLFQFSAKDIDGRIVDFR